MNSEALIPEEVVPLKLFQFIFLVFFLVLLLAPKYGECVEVIDFLFFYMHLAFGIPDDGGRFDLLFLFFSKLFY